MLGVAWRGPLAPHARIGEEAAVLGIDGPPGADAASPERRSGDALQGPSPEAEALAVLVSVEGIGPATIDRLVARLGSAVEILRMALHPDGERLIVAAGHRADGRHAHLETALAAAVVAAARGRAAFLDRLAALAVRPVALVDPDYPSRLREIEMAPPVLFVRGHVAALARPSAIAVVGTRRPTDAGRRTAARIASGLVRAGATVISGLATGIDGSAHAATLAEGGTTVAVIGGGHARLFPRAHARLADAIVSSGGAVISEHAPDVGPTKGTFPRRNRIISGLAQAVVIVEAGASSGALLTGSWALEQGREVFAVPGPIDAPASAGCNGFLREFPGLVRIVSGIPQLLDDLGLPGAAGLPGGTGLLQPAAGSGLTRTARRTAMPPDRHGSVAPPSADALLTLLDPLEALIAEAVLAGAATVDELVAVTRAPVAAVLAALTRLETAGLVEIAHGRCRSTPRLGVMAARKGSEGTVAPAA